MKMVQPFQTDSRLVATHMPYTLLMHGKVC